MKPTSLWELRKRPLPRQMMLSPPPAQRARLDKVKATPELHTPLRRLAEKDDSTARQIHPVQVLASQRCLYHLGNCSNMRATKANGFLHTLCTVHRDRSLANQRRFDEKRRRERQQKQAAKDKAKRNKRRQIKLKSRTPSATPGIQIPPLKFACPKTNNPVGLPSFKSFTSALLLLPRSFSADRKGDVKTTEDTSRAWLAPFETNGACAEASASASSLAWRTTAVAQFLHPPN